MSAAAPKISVLVPIYNVEPFLNQAIQSVVEQTFSDWELLLLDDASPDNSRAIAEAWQQKDPRIQLLINDRNAGVAKTRNHGISLARGEYIAFLDGDDFWHPEKLERQINQMTNTDADIVYCSYALVDENGDTKHKDFIVPERTDLDKMLIHNVMSCSTVILKTALVKQRGFETAYYHEDYALWLRLLRDGHQAVGCTEVLSSYRVRAMSRSADKLSSAKNRWIIYREYLKLPFFRSVACFYRYAVAGLKKYK